jgi:hypothetical protein
VCRISYANELWLGCLFLGHAPVQAMPVQAMFSTVLFNLRMSNSPKPRLMAPTKYASGRIGMLTLNARREEAATLVCTVTGTVLSLLGHGFLLSHAFPPLGSLHSRWARSRVANLEAT